MKWQSLELASFPNGMQVATGDSVVRPQLVIDDVTTQQELGRIEVTGPVGAVR